MLKKKALNYEVLTNEKNMPLNQQQINQLGDAINGYDFPAVYYDCSNNVGIAAENMRDLEAEINRQLRSQNASITKCGLASVLYWGYSRIGYGATRVQDFINNVSEQKINAFQELTNGDNVPTMIEIHHICMPQYSGISFVSNILMFLNPRDYCVLDQQIAKLRTNVFPKALNNLVFRGNEQIRFTNHNNDVYTSWCNECSTISQIYFEDRYRVVDVERGFFNLIQNDNLHEAQAIYNTA